MFFLDSFPCGTVCDSYPHISEIFSDAEKDERYAEEGPKKPGRCLLDSYRETEEEKQKPRKLCWKNLNLKDGDQTWVTKTRYSSRLADYCQE
ncbi:hypothetical protein [Candidatus Mycoplasma haematohominis]|uniref:Uncharacterized protein n=1 Tax=Candidatus Mycoplasma haematohominis TaxID=1494318 RepID=A0A478FTM6_9MOLU|nr:hypothetical protein [Candidatus Mycoplasma haemohominis]GCE63380.1 hypothetical protein MHSWG343_03760 [Candidatus Mycoplasma haemohominis]GCE63398.1 hypothetical protein MHSWG343_03940 [Candidatus Mycoplasma haemohominis]GCE63400.1 hypothetical protein MHSWG343_03960 [Candidatus Mycoplasma haemohominis]